VTCGFLRLDEQVHVYRVSVAKKAVARQGVDVLPRDARETARAYTSDFIGGATSVVLCA
jgi:hypothetical protein